MKNITLNIIGQRVLADVLFEKKNIINMEILFFLNFEDYFSKIKNNNTNSIIITEFSNFSLIENSKQKINFPIFYLANNRKKDTDSKPKKIDISKYITITKEQEFEKLINTLFGTHKF